jgi:hypothetical protein
MASDFETITEEGEHVMKSLVVFTPSVTLYEPRHFIPPDKPTAKASRPAS